MESEDEHEDEEYDKTDENEQAGIMNEPNQHEITDENDRNVQLINDNVQHDNDDPVENKTMKTLKRRRRYNS